MASRQKPWSPDVNFRNSVAANIDNIVKKVETLACKVEREQVRATPLILVLSF